jgi:SH3-like domain-containing protein
LRVLAAFTLKKSNRPSVALSAAALVLSLSIVGAAAQNPIRGTGLPLPRFVSLKSDDVNVRRGPGQEYDIAFTFVKAGLPVEITQEFDNWRKIRDSEGAEGWVFHSLLSGKRTALVAPWEIGGANEPYAAHADPDPASAVLAYLTPKVVAEVEECRGAWCLVSGRGYRGWIEQEKLWGVYPNEEFEE